MNFSLYLYSHHPLILYQLELLAGVRQVVDGLQRLTNLPLLLLHRVDPGVRVLPDLGVRRKISFQDIEYWSTWSTSDQGMSDLRVLALAPVMLKSAVASSLEVQPE